MDIVFPTEIFDASATAVPTLPGEFFGMDAPVVEGAASCGGPEMEMRSQAWLIAVQENCLNLSDVILTLCQQAADYAPTTGECSRSGAW